MKMEQSPHQTLACDLKVCATLSTRLCRIYYFKMNDAKKDGRRIIRV